MYRLLNNSDTYKKLSLDPTIKYKKELELILQAARTKGIIYEREFNYLNVPKCYPKFWKICFRD